MAKKFDFNIFEKIVPILLISTVGLAFVVGMLWEKVKGLEGGKTGTVAQQTTTQGTTATTQPAANISIDTIKALFENKELISFGDKDKKILFVEVADPSCPYCHAAAGHDKEVNAQLGPNFKLVSDGGTYVAPVIEMKKLVDSGEAGFVYVYYPGHGNGEMGTKALYCGQEKGKFWEVHDLLMSNAGYNLMNNDIKNDKAQSGKLADFLKSAVSSGDMKNCLDSGKYDDRLTADMAIAQSLNVKATPGFFVDTTFFEGAYSFKDMETAVNTAKEN